MANHTFRKASRTLAFFGCVLLIVFCITGCTQGKTPNPSGTQNADQTTVRIATLKGPTGMGMVQLMKDGEDGKNPYEFTVAAAPDEIVGKITTGEVDIAAVPTNLAAVLSQKTGGKVKLAAINTLGVLYLAQNGDSIHSFADLKGKTICMSGQGAVPEYVLHYLLRENGLDPQTDVTIDYQTEHSAVASMLLAGKADVALLPEPFVTQVKAKSDQAAVSLDITKEWEKAVGEDKSLAMGCLLVRSEFLDQHKAAVDQFLASYQKSTEYINQEPEAGSALVEQYLDMPAGVAKAAIPNCNIVFISGSDMKQAAESFLSILYEAQPSSVGGKLPDESFYYQG